MCTVVFPPGGGVNWPERGVYHLPPSSAEVEMEWSYVSAPPLCLHDMYGKTTFFASEIIRSHLSSFILPILPSPISIRGTESLLNNMFPIVQDIPNCRPDNHINRYSSLPDEARNTLLVLCDNIVLSPIP